MRTTFKKGNDRLTLGHKIWRLQDERRAEYPAEHNVRHLYFSKHEPKSFYQSLDPCNC
jgi:D-lactate dehydrogenase